MRRAFSTWIKELVGIRKVVDNWKMYEEYGIEDEEGYDENGMRKATGCMGEEFYYMVEDRPDYERFH